MNKKTLSIKDLTLLAVFIAIIIMQTSIPNLGYIRFALVDFTIIHVTVIIGSCVLGWKKGAILGGVWGISSMMYAYSTPGLLNPLFYNPLVSIVPRILVGLVSGIVVNLFTNKLTDTIRLAMAGVVGTLTNTVLVLSSFYIFGYEFLFKTLNLTQGAVDPVLVFVLSLVTTNTLFEIIVASIVVPVVVKPIQKLIK